MASRFQQSTTHNKVSVTLLDRLSNLPDELLIQILSLLPTKDAAATCVLSKRLSRILPWTTTLDLDLSPISLCVTRPHSIQHFPSFVTFVDNVLEKHQSQQLTKFRLQCKDRRVPDLPLDQVMAWIAFPLTHHYYSGLRELDISILAKDSGDNDLPLEIFTCETLEVLKLDINNYLFRVCTMPAYRLPNLKLLHLKASNTTEYDFVTRLVSSCPVLEDLSVESWTDSHLIIVSPSIKRLRINLPKPGPFKFVSSDYVSIDTPNLEYFECLDTLARAYDNAIPLMPSLIKADISMNCDSQFRGRIDCYRRLLRFIKSLSHLHDLSLFGCFMKAFDRVEVKNALPMFPNLKHLKLGCGSKKIHWDRFLLALLNCSPVLETLVFGQGLTLYPAATNGIASQLVTRVDLFHNVQTVPGSPLCCRNHLKRIVIKNFMGSEGEVEVIEFLLRHALVLEELVIYRRTDYDYPVAALMSLPKASTNCSIQVLQSPLP